MGTKGHLFWEHAEEAEKQQSRSAVTEQIPVTPKEHRRLASSPNDTNTMNYSCRLPELVLRQKSAEQVRTFELEKTRSDERFCDGLAGDDGRTGYREKPRTQKTSRHERMLLAKHTQ